MSIRYAKDNDREKRESEREKIEGEKVVYPKLLHKRMPLNYYTKLSPRAKYSK